MNTPRTFAARWSGLLKGVSAAVVLLLLIVGPGGRMLGWYAGPLDWLAVVLPLGGIAVAALFVVRGYEVQGRTLHILRPGWRTSVPLAGLKEVQSGGALLDGSLRVFGNGGFFSFTGWYWSRRLGVYRMFVTDLKRVVGLRLPTRWVLVSPEDIDGFVDAVRKGATS